MQSGGSRLGRRSYLSCSVLRRAIVVRPIAPQVLVAPPPCRRVINDRKKTLLIRSWQNELACSISVELSVPFPLRFLFASQPKIMGKALDNADEDPMDQLRGHSMHIIACIEDPAIINKILEHSQEKSPRDSGIRTPILVRRHKLARSASLAESSCFTHVAIRNGFDTTAGMQEVEQRRSSCRGSRLV